MMAFFYLLMAVCVPLVFLADNPPAVWGFALLFRFGVGADYMLIPLVTAESFGLEALGKLLALIISVYSIGTCLNYHESQPFKCRNYNTRGTRVPRCATACRRSEPATFWPPGFGTFAIRATHLHAGPGADRPAPARNECRCWRG
jgi:hypothetical protein